MTSPSAPQIGTLAPLVLEVFEVGKISIGPPWFEIAFSIPMLPLVFLIGVGMHTAWRQQALDPLSKQLRIPALIALVAGVIVPGVFYGRFGILVTVGCIAGFWAAATAVMPVIRSLRRQPGTPGITRAALGMSIAHFGVGMFTFGVTIVSAFSTEADRSMVVGQPVEASGYEFELRSLRNVEGPNFRAIEGEIEIRRDGEFVAELRPQKRTYLVQQNPMTEAGIDVAWNRDLFVALGDSLGQGAWSVRLQYKPFIRFIWLGCLFVLTTQR